MIKVYQSFTVSHLAADFTVLEVRILAYLVASFQSPFVQKKNYLKNNIDNPKGLMNYDILTPRHVMIPITAILSDGSHHYEEVAAAAKRLCDRTIEYCDASDPRPRHREWYISSMLQQAKIIEGKGYIDAWVAPWFLNILYKLFISFSSYDYEVLGHLKLVSSMRMYMLTCSATKTLSYSVETLKKIFGVTEKYKQTGDFIKWVLLPAAKELEKLKVNGFTVEPVKKGNRIEVINIIPVKRTDYYTNLASEGFKRKGLNNNNPQSIIVKALRSEYKFTPKQLLDNGQVITAFSCIPDVITIWKRIEARCANLVLENKCPNTVAYIIGAFRAELKSFTDQTGITENALITTGITGAQEISPNW